jgi:hypothetical protein
VICKYDESSGSPNSALLTVNDRPRARPKLVKRYRARGRGYNPRSASTAGVTRPALLGEYIVWGATASDTGRELFRQRGCGQARERADRVGRLLAAATFTYVKLSPASQDLYLSDRLPSFGPVS